MAEDLVKRLRGRILRLGASPGSMLDFMNGIAPLLKESADLIEQQAASLAAKDKENSRWRENMRQNYDAFTAMRNDINEIVGNMVSQESTLQYGPEMAHECEAVVEAVRSSIAIKETAIAEAARLAHKLMTRAVAAESRAEQAERALAEAVEVMRPFAKYLDKLDCEWAHDSGEIGQFLVDGLRHSIKFGHLRAARAFVAQHGSDSREGK